MMIWLVQSGTLLLAGVTEPNWMEIAYTFIPILVPSNVVT